MKKYNSITVTGTSSSYIDNTYPANYQSALEQINKEGGEIIQIFTSEFPVADVMHEVQTIITYCVTE